MIKSRRFCYDDIEVLDIYKIMVDFSNIITSLNLNGYIMDYQENFDFMLEYLYLRKQMNIYLQKQIIIYGNK